MGSRVRRRSSLTTELPAEIRAEVDRLLLEPGVTYDDIKAHLEGKGFDISRSAIGRYGKEFLNTYQRLRMVEDQAKALVSATGEGLVLEEAASKLVTQQILEALVNTDLDVLGKAKLVDAFAKLQSSSIQREKFKAEIEKKVKAANEDITKTLKAKGLSDEAVDEINQRILGII